MGVDSLNIFYNLHDQFYMQHKYKYINTPTRTRYLFEITSFQYTTNFTNMNFDWTLVVFAYIARILKMRISE